MERGIMRDSGGVGPLERAVRPRLRLAASVEPGVAYPPEASDPRAAEPETWLLVLVWVLALAAIGAGIVRGGLFSADASLALLFALFGGFLLHEPAVELMTRARGSRAYRR